jgi:ATP-dependent RNA helicase DDX52/ROK1
MDLFKLLTRSTKINKTSTPSGSIPSAGQTANPQLFGDEAAKSQPVVLGKRKRANGRDADESLPADIDFFANGKKELVSVVPLAEKQSPHAKYRQVELENLDLDGCKRVLRSHKIKISLLSVEASVGKKAPLVYTQPLTSFTQLVSRYGLRHKVMENLESQGYSVPTEIQLSALPLLMGEELLHEPDSGPLNVEDRSPIDLLAVAPTGSGKTLAFLIPIINSLLSKRIKDSPRRDGPYAVILAPTRELAGQIVNEGRKLAQNTGLKVTLIKKGMRIGDETETLPALQESDDSDPNSDSADSEAEAEKIARTTIVKSDIIVSTPLSLLHALRTPSGELSTLPSIEHLVLDEADVLLDSLFQTQTLSLWKSCSSPSLRVSLWSATMPSSIESLAQSTINSHSQNPTIIRLIIGLKDSALPTLEHKLVYAATETGKLLALRQLLRPTSSATDLRPPFLVFTQTIPRATALHAELRYDIPPEAGGSSRIAVLHAGLSESARARVMAGVRRGDIWVVVTTDLLARGVDFRGLNGVVNYDVPTSVAAYVHRAGRTGRAGRKGGVVVTLYTEEDVSMVRPIVNVISESEKAAGKEGGRDWLLAMLPQVGKRDRKEVKRRGVEVRRTVHADTSGNHGKTRDGKVRKKSVISTKLPERRRGAKNGKEKKTGTGVVESEFEGFDD